MSYIIHHVVELTGVAPRTIRGYIKRGLVPPPAGVGLAAEYDDEHVLRISAVAGLRAQGESLEAIAEQLPGWSPAKLRSFVARWRATQSRAQQAAAAEASGAVAPAPQPVTQAPPADAAGAGEPVPRAALPREASPGPRPGAVEPGAAGAASLPDGPRWVLVSLLPGLALMVRDDAAPLVKRAATEIYERYSAT
jgi:DNA-binding transcriptional MerR regulator